MRVKRCAALLAAVMCLSGSAFALDKPVVDGSAPMTIAQVRRGADLYAAKCANCHGAQLEGKTATALTGPTFAGKWANQTAEDLFNRTKTMPYGAPNSLQIGDYIDLTAFVLSHNGATTGAGDLSSNPDALKQIKAVQVAGGQAAAPAGPVSKTTTIRPIGDIIGAGPTQAELSAVTPKTTDWLFTNHDYQGQRFVDADQITRRNVADLKPVCMYQVGDTNPFPTNPLVYKGQMFITSRDAVVSLDAATCKVNWRYDRKSRVPVSFGLKMNRGAALKDGKLVFGTHDGFLIALDAGTGKELWVRDISGDPQNGGGGVNMAPLLYDDLVVVAPAGSELDVKGWIGAFKLATGEPVWRFNTVPDDNEPGADSWPSHAARQHGGGSVWGSLGLDVAKGQLFLPVSNPTPDFDGDARKGDNLYTCAIVVLDVRTGKLIWFYQVTPHDTHDYDLTQAVPLFNAKIDGKMRNLVVAAGKEGTVHVLDRDTHEHLYVVPVTTRQNTDKPWIAIDTTAGGERVCPGAIGGVQWQGPSFNPDTNRLYVDAADFCSITRDPTDKSRGWLTAIDASTGKIAWQYSAERPMLAAVTTTSSKLVFGGELDGNVVAFDAENGKKLFNFNVGGPITGGIATYMVGKRQYLVAASGAANSFWRAAPGSSTIIVFALP
ncbi:MAG TPA: PQQ-binding-like beta-propeller repeat protein [Alphaproteobacteria bacterium]|nr:PQQ-binding-like beta-propeller repeat protein [Alphaproteobacteria bacterium]